jgi:predicted metal-dependent peptidase
VSEIDIRVVRARAALVMDHPFFGALAMRLHVMPTTAYDTMATDGRRLLYNAAFLDEITQRQLVAIVAHEVLHCAMNHHTRRGGRDAALWNKACDYVINLILKRAGFDLPEWVLLDASYEGLGAEQVYRILAQQQQQPSQQEQDQQSAASGQGGDSDDDTGDERADDNADDDNDAGGDDEGTGDADDSDAGGGSGDDDQGAEQDSGESDGEGGGDANDGQAEAPSKSGGDPGRCGEVIDAAPEHDEGAIADAEAEWEVATRQAVNIAKKQNAGSVPGFLQEVVDDLANPRTDWREVYRRFIDPSSTKDYAWSRPNRRMLSQGLYTPGLISDGVNHVAIIVDSSGSVDRDALRTFGGEAQASLDEGAIDRLTLIFADTDVRRVASYERGERIDFSVVGRGGTRFSPAFAWLNENAPDIAVAVYFTDLECSDFGSEPLYPVLWAAYGDPREIKSYAEALPFGDCIDVQS